MDDNQRHFSRSATDVEVELRLKGGRVLRGKTTDVSVKGMFVSCEPVSGVGTQTVARIRLGHSPSGVEISAKGRVARVHDDGVAIEFTEVSIEAMKHLIQLVRSHSEDAEQVDREFRENPKRPKAD